MGYDRKKSPLDTPGATNKVLGKGGLVDAAGGFIEDLSNGNFLRAAKTAGTAYNTFKNTDLKSKLKTEFAATVTDAIRNGSNTNRNTNVNIPKSGASPGPAAMSGSPTVGANSSPNKLGKTPTAGEQISGAITNATANVITNPVRAVGRFLSGG